MTHLSKMNMLTSLDACDPMPAFGRNVHSLRDPRMEITQIQECAAGDARMQKYAEERHFETINYTPDLDKITGKKTQGLPSAPKKKLCGGRAQVVSMGNSMLATVPTLESPEAWRVMTKSVQELMEEACGIPDSGFDSIILPRAPRF